MKKLILSAVFAVACFTAQAKSEVVSNDDKNPKNKVKKEVVANSKKELSLLPTCRGGFTVTCTGGATYTGTVSWESDDCAGSGKKILKRLGTALCD